MVASVEAADDEFGTVGLVSEIAVNVDTATRRIRGHLDATLRNLGAEVEVVAAVLARPDIHTLIHKFKALVDDDERLAARLDFLILDRTLAERFTAEEHVTVRRFSNDVDRCGLATRRWIIIVSDGGREEECHHQGKNKKLFHGLYS